MSVINAACVLATRRRALGRDLPQGKEKDFPRIDSDSGRTGLGIAGDGSAQLQDFALRTKPATPRGLTPPASFALR